MKVIYQVIKCFLLSRITWKGYQMQQQGGAETSAGDVSARSDTKRKGEKPPVSTGRACQGSNVYSEAEMVLIQWLCDRVRSLHKPQQPAVAPMASLGGALLETQLLDIGRDLRDGRWLFHLVAAHIPTLSVDQSAYHCFRWMPEALSSRPRGRLQPLSCSIKRLYCYKLWGRLGLTSAWTQRDSYGDIPVVRCCCCCFTCSRRCLSLSPRLRSSSKEDWVR